MESPTDGHGPGMPGLPVQHHGGGSCVREPSGGEAQAAQPGAAPTEPWSLKENSSRKQGPS